MACILKIVRSNVRYFVLVVKHVMACVLKIVRSNVRYFVLVVKHL